MYHQLLEENRRQLEHSADLQTRLGDYFREQKVIYIFAFLQTSIYSTTMMSWNLSPPHTYCINIYPCEQIDDVRDRGEGYKGGGGNQHEQRFHKIIHQLTEWTNERNAINEYYHQTISTARTKYVYL